MCGRFAVTLPPEAIASLFGTSDIVDFAPSYNIAPTQNVPIIAIGKEKIRRTILARWGLLPQFQLKEHSGGPLINARAETIDEKPSFKTAFAKRRCIVPASGFYEWYREDNKKTPYYISRRDGAPMAFAGLWEMQKREKISDEGLSEEIIISTTIVTTKSHGEFANIHNRSPVILEQEAWPLWLENSTPKPRLESLMFAPDTGVLKWHQISDNVNKIANNSEELIMPIKA